MDWLKKFAHKRDKNSETSDSALSTGAIDEPTDITIPDHLNDQAFISVDQTSTESEHTDTMASHAIASDAIEEVVAITPEMPKSDPIDASVDVRISSDLMSATLILHAPENGGEDITAEKILTELAARNIVFGINKAMLSLKVRALRYEEPFTIAVGLPPKDGENGKIIELVDREKKISFTENKFGNVDYKNLNLINEIEANTVLCEIIPSIAPQQGNNIFGHDLYGKPGITPTIPQGENTVLIEDGTKLIASKKGNLVYRNNRFHVSQVLEIPEDVDNSTGNITFSGDVLVKGSVYEGYKITAGGNVTVYGIVEGVYISAGGDINLKQGINGMSKGVIEAKGKIVCRYLENCTARATGSISAETIIHSNVYSGDSISVVGSRSTIIGGVCSALQSIDVHTIGNRMNTMTTIMLGATTELIEERKSLAEEVIVLEKRLTEIALDIKFIEQRISARNLTDKHKAMLKNHQIEYPEINAKLEERRKRVNELESIIQNNVSCRLNCTHIYPPAKIMIGSETVLVQVDRNRCTVFYSEGEIKFSYT